MKKMQLAHHAFTGSPEGKIERAIETLTDLIARHHWSSQETRESIHDARTSGQFDTYREMFNALLDDCTESKCSGEKCVHDRLIERMQEAMMEIGADGQRRTSH